MNLLQELPLFPELKPLALQDHSILQPFLNRFEPYSDYNFASMWCYNTKEKMEIAQLHNNLIVKFEDYVTSEHFFSFLGEHEPNTTAHILIEYSIRQGLAGILKLIPDVVAERLKVSTQFRVMEDEDNFDYVLSTEEVSSLATTKFHTQKNHLNRFEKNYPECLPVILDASDKKTHEILLEVFYKWEKGRGKERNETQHELTALERFLYHAHLFCPIVIAAEYKGNYLGFIVAELIGTEYAIVHFAKSDPSYKEAYIFLNNSLAKHLWNMGYHYMNIEQDLGIPGLKYAKKQWNPIQYFKKYTIAFNE